MGDKTSRHNNGGFPIILSSPLYKVPGRLSLLYNDAYWAQFGYRYAVTACSERSELYGDFGTY
jgi:hypothetical protein